MLLLSLAFMVCVCHLHLMSYTEKVDSSCGFVCVLSFGTKSTENAYLYGCYYAGTQRMASRVEFMPQGMGDEPQQPEQAEQPDSQEQASEMASGQTSGQTELTDGSGNASDENASGEKQPSKEEKEAMREYQKLLQMEVAKVDASGGSESASGTEESEAVEPDLYYYHTDHLGSTSIITDRNGNVAQYLAYTPYGETFIEERDVTPYKFNGKEPVLM